MNSNLSDFLYFKMNRQLSLFDYAKVVVVGAELARLLQIDPDVAVDLLLLNLHVVGEGSREEEYNALAYLAEGTVLADFAEALNESNVQSRFLLDLADSGLLFGLTLLDVTLREAPVPAVIVLDEENLCVLPRLVENYAAAGFLVQTAYRLELYVSQPREDLSQLGLIENLAVGRYDPSLMLPNSETLTFSAIILPPPFIIFQTKI